MAEELVVGVWFASLYEVTGLWLAPAALAGAGRLFEFTSPTRLQAS